MISGLIHTLIDSKDTVNGIIFHYVSLARSQRTGKCSSIQSVFGDPWLRDAWKDIGAAWVGPQALCDVRWPVSQCGTSAAPKSRTGHVRWQRLTPTDPTEVAAQLALHLFASRRYHIFVSRQRERCAPHPSSLNFRQGNVRTSGLTR